MNEVEDQQNALNWALQGATSLGRVDSIDIEPAKVKVPITLADYIEEPWTIKTSQKKTSDTIYTSWTGSAFIQRTPSVSGS